MKSVICFIYNLWLTLKITTGNSRYEFTETFHSYFKLLFEKLFQFLTFSQERVSEDNKSTNIDSILERENGSPNTTPFSLNNKSATDQSPRNNSTPSIDLSGKIERELKTLQRKLSKAKKLFAAIERLSSGNPKPKSLSLCFKEINASITPELIQELEYREPWCQVIRKNVIDLQQHLLADRPGERELEHIRIIVGEVTGRISIILKSNMLES